MSSKKKHFSEWSCFHKKDTAEVLVQKRSLFLSATQEKGGSEAPSVSPCMSSRETNTN